MVSASTHSYDPVLPPAPNEALLAAVIDLSKDLELRPLLRRLVETAANLTGAQYGALGVLNADGSFEDLVIYGMDDDLIASLGDAPHGRGVLGTLIHTPKTLRLADISHHTDSVGFPPGHPPMKTFLGCPVIIRGEVFGNLYLTEKAGDEEFTETDERVIEALATAAASAIAHARTIERVQERERWQRAGSELSQIITTMPTHQAWPEATSRLRTILEAQYCELAPPRRSPEELREGPDAASLRAVARPLDADLASEMADADMNCGVLIPVGTPDLAAGTLTLAWDIDHASVPLEMRLRLAQTLADRLTVASLLASRHAEAERMAILEDRDRIAQDLHDHVIQRIFAAGMRVQAAMALSQKDDVVAKLDDVVTDLDDTVADVRRAIFELHEGHAALGLASSIDKVAKAAREQLGFMPAVTISGEYWTLDDALVFDLLAVAREALSNAARHASATAVDLVLCVDDHVTLQIIDDGVGLPAQLTRNSGLAHLAARAERRNGTFDAGKTVGGGTTISWSAPLMR